jgi:cobalt-precorrin 5A hydrolase
LTGPRPLAVHAITQGGLEVAARLAAVLGADVRVPERLLALAPASARAFSLPMRDALAPAFPRYRGHVFVMAIGAVVRMIAPLLESKWRDPAVVCVDEAGRFAVSVLSGHAGGANSLAEEVAAVLGAQAVVTTASDVLGTLQVDLLGCEFGWTIEDPARNATRASAAVVEAAPVLVVQEAGERYFWPQDLAQDRPLPPNVTVATTLEAADPGHFEALLLVTDRLPAERERALFERAVVYRPRSLVLGIGCDRGAAPDLVARGVETLLARHRLALASVREIATIALKAGEPALRALAERLACPLRLFGSAELDAAPGVETFSETVRRHVGTRAVAEPAALLASGASRLLVPRQIYTEPGAGRSMTLAAARIPFSPERRASTHV